jgi:putative ABC transport system permease protein
MVGAQVAVCVVLVSMLGVFAAAYRAYAAVDPGYDARRLVRAAPDWQAAGMDAAAQWAVARQVAERVRHDPAVSAVALWHLMMGAWPPQPRYAAVIDGAPGHGVGTPYRVDPGFFRAIGIELLRGRGFTDADNAGSRPVVVVTKDGADAWWPGQNPLGHRIRFGKDAPWMTVVGVVSHVGPVGGSGRFWTIILKLQKRQMPSVFVPARQWLTLPPGWRENADCDECEGVSMAVRASGEVSQAGKALRSALHAAAPDLPLNFVATIYDRQMSSSYAARQIVPPGRLAAAGSVVGLLLAVLGIVGVVADGVARRTREIGVRMALGAPAAGVLGAVARESILTGLAGLGAGLAVLIALHGAISKRVIDMQIRSLTPKLIDPMLLAAAAGVVLALVLLAALATARRALRVDPAEALRSE